MIQQNGKTLLEVRGLCATVNGIDILKGIDLTVRSGEVHALMGPNGSGKSTFAKALAGHPAYVVTGGTVFYEGKNLLELKPEERARAGVFLGFQYPIEIPGVANSQFLRLAYNTVQAQRGNDELDPLEFDDFVREKMKLLEMNPDFLDRSVNEGFSGGEKKPNFRRGLPRKPACRTATVAREPVGVAQQAARGGRRPRRRADGTHDPRRGVALHRPFAAHQGDLPAGAHACLSEER